MYCKISKFAGCLFNCYDSLLWSNVQGSGGTTAPVYVLTLLSCELLSIMESSDVFPVSLHEDTSSGMAYSA
ncbi:hypothetical protein EMCRGX_G002907 [Ephydatia muelleri]